MNLVILNSLESLKEFTADTIIDVRAPAEYADDHLPGAINLPVLDDTQRAEIGTVYKQNPFMARKKGAAEQSRWRGAPFGVPALLYNGAAAAAHWLGNRGVRR